MAFRFNDIIDLINEDIKEELRLQGHYLDGSLERSFTEDQDKITGGYSLSAEALGYIRDLEEGIRPEHIATDQTAIREMTDYVQKRMGYTGKYAIKVAIAIINKQRKEGMPTQNSYNYSQTGERLDAVAEVFKKRGAFYISLIDNDVIDALDFEAKQIKSGTI